MAITRIGSSIFSNHTYTSDEKLVGTYVAGDSEAPDAREAALKTAYRKIDRRLLTWYILTFTLIGIEAQNIVNSAIMNKEAGDDIKHQLGNLTDEQWALVLSSAAYPGLLLEPFSTLMLKKWTPRNWIGRIMISWGIVAMSVGAVQNFGGLFSTRLLLGAAEAGFLPCILYHMSFWYPASKLTVRIALIAGLKALVSAFSGLLAFAISHLNNKAGLAGWRWYFILEGIPALFAGIVTLFWLPNYPETATFLTNAEKEAVIANKPARQPKEADSAWDWTAIKALMKRPSTYTFYLTFLGNAMGNFGIANVFPTVIFQLGITNSTHTQLLNIPGSVVHGATLLGLAWLIQCKRLPSWATAFVLEVVAAAAYIGLLFIKSAIGRFVVIVAAISVAIPVFTILIPERLGTIQGASATALAIGLVTSAPELNHVVGPQIWLERFGPTYHTSIKISIGLISVTAVMILVTKWSLRREGWLASRDGVLEDAINGDSAV